MRLRDAMGRGLMMVAWAALALAVQPSGRVTAAEAKTLKEQLSDKGSDEQRVDNCGVPPERRGPVPRPDCATKELPAAAPARPGGSGDGTSTAESR